MLSLRPETETNRTQAVLGGNLVHFPGNVSTPTADMMIFMTRYKYVKMRLSDIPDKVVQE